MMELAVNPYYPYQKVEDYTTMPDAETLLKKIVDYLLDLPMKGYTPPSDTSTPRSRLIRILYYDTPHPLEEPLPTPPAEDSDRIRPGKPGRAAGQGERVQGVPDDLPDPGGEHGADIAQDFYELCKAQFG